MHDVPPTLDLVLQKSGSEKVQLIGWSQGGQVFFGFLSEQPKYQNKVGLLCRSRVCYLYKTFLLAGAFSNFMLVT